MCEPTRMARQDKCVTQIDQPRPRTVTILVGGFPRTRCASSIPYITRQIPYYEVLTEEGLALLETNADTILEEIGIDFRDDPEALDIWQAAGADVQGGRVHFAGGMCCA